MKKMYQLANGSTWLESKVTDVTSKSYRHHHIKENVAHRSQFIDNFTQIFVRAHEHVKKHLSSLCSKSLDPLEEPSSFDPCSGYPESLPLRTLQGYFGEIMAAMIIETHAPFGNNHWFVPVIPFRFHIGAFQYLEKVRQNATSATQVFGRTGDDCVAFEVKDGKVTAVLMCEAKCTLSHDSRLINEVHDNISSSHTTPVDMMQIIEILKDMNYDDTYIAPLKRLWSEIYQEKPPRYDAIVYVYSQLPKEKPFWLSSSDPNAQYTGKRPLEAIEVYIDDVEDMIYNVYGKSRTTSSVS